MPHSDDPHVIEDGTPYQLSERIERLIMLVEERSHAGGPLGTALNAILPHFDPPAMSEDEAQAIAACVASCAAPDSEPVPLPFGRELDGLMYAINRLLSDRHIPVRAYMRHEGIETVIEDGLKREIKVPAAVMVRRMECGQRRK